MLSNKILLHVAVSQFKVDGLRGMLSNKILLLIFILIYRKERLRGILSNKILLPKHTYFASSNV